MSMGLFNRKGFSSILFKSFLCEFCFQEFVVKCFILLIESEIVDLMDVVDFDVIYNVRWFIIMEIVINMCDVLFKMVCEIFFEG